MGEIAAQKGSVICSGWGTELENSDIKIWTKLVCSRTWDLNPCIMCSPIGNGFVDIYLLFWNANSLHSGTVLYILLPEPRTVLSLEQTFSIHVLNKWLGVRHGFIPYLLHHWKNSFSFLENNILPHMQNWNYSTNLFQSADVRNKWDN